MENGLKLNGFNCNYGLKMYFFITILTKLEGYMQKNTRENEALNVNSN